MKNRIAFLIFSLSLTLGFAQQSTLDSLKKELAIAKQDSVKTKLMCRIGTEEGVSRLGFWDSIILDSKKWNLHSSEAMAYINRGYIYFQQNKLKATEVDWKNALTISEKYKDDEAGPAAANNLAYLYEHKGAMSEAIDLYYKSLDFLERSKDDAGRGSTYNNLASIYFDLGDMEKAMECSRKTISIRLQIKDSVQLAASLNNMGYYLQFQKQYAAALAYYDKALVIIKKQNLKGLLPNTLYNIGTIIGEKGDYEKAIEKLNECLSIYRENGNSGGQSNSLSSIADNQIRQGKYNDAIKSGEEALVLGKKLGYVAPLKHAYKVLYDGYKATGNKVKALEMYEQYIVMKDSVSKDENQKASIQRQMKFAFDNKAIADSIKNTEKIKLETQKHEQEIKQQKLYTYGGVIGFILMILVAGVSFRAYRLKQKTNVIIEEQKLIVEEKQKEIVDSINYAKRIQYAMLAQDELLKNNLNDYFVLFQPKDIVSGDFYWATNKDGRFYLAVCDSTGHGVPGAFMSLLNISFLNEAITEKNIVEPNKIFDHVRKRLIENVSQEGAQDGMDGIIICFDKEKITYSAAHNPPVIVTNLEFKELAYDKMPVGKGEKEEPFKLHQIEYKKGDVLYFYTDGYADQFGGKSGKKFKYKQLQQLLSMHCEKPMTEQNDIYTKTINDWKGNLEQVDDILVIGIRL